MALEEKRAWIMGVISALAYGVYLVVVLGRAGESGVVDTAYVGPLLWTVGGAIVVQIVLNIAAAVVSPEDAGVDQRDREIGRFGDHVGQSFVVLGGLGALVLAMAEVDHFWIANTIYLGFVLSAVLGSMARVAAYRRGFQPW